MQRTGPSYAGDSESLQADVMRFMAIIAFCLIAILALVRNTEPADPSSVEPEPALVVAVETPVSEPALPEPVQHTPALPAPVAPEPTPRPEAPATAVEPPEAGETSVLAASDPVERAPEIEPATSVAAAMESSPEPEAASEAEADAEADAEGLTLRFASDGDFLRLIARGDIRVYAFQDTDVLTLSETYRFLDTSAPGQVYELLPPSIPSLILDALRQARSDTAGYRWGIALPGRISHQIEQHLNRVRRGELVIDRYGDVHHVAAT